MFLKILKSKLQVKRLAFVEKSLTAYMAATTSADEEILAIKYAKPPEQCGSVCRAVINDTRFLKYSDSSFFTRVALDYVAISKLNNKELYQLKVRASYGPFYSYQTVARPGNPPKSVDDLLRGSDPVYQVATRATEAMAEKAFDLDCYYEIAVHAVIRLVREWQSLLVRLNIAKQLNYLALKLVNAEPDSTSQRSYLMTILQLLDQTPSLKPQVDAMSWGGYSILDRLQDELIDEQGHHLYCRTVKQQMLSLLDDCLKEINRRSKNTTKAAQIARLRSAISSKTFPETLDGATRLGAYITLAERLVRHKQSWTASKTHEHQQPGFMHLRLLLSNGFTDLTQRHELEFQQPGCCGFFGGGAKLVSFALYQTAAPAIQAAIDTLNHPFNGTLNIDWGATDEAVAVPAYGATMQ